MTYYSRVADQPQGLRARRAVRTAGQHSLGADQPRHRDHRSAVVIASDDWLLTPLQFLRGVGPRRAADLERVGLLTAEDLLAAFSAALRGSCRPSCRWARCVPARPSPSSARSSPPACAPRGDPGFRLFELVDSRRDGIRARRVSQSGVSEGRVSSGPAGRALRRRRVPQRAAAHQSRSTRCSSGEARRGRRDRSRRSHRADLREGRIGDDAHAADLVHRLLSDAARGAADPLPASDARGAASGPIAGRRSSTRIFRRRASTSTISTRSGRRHSVV